MKSPPGSGAVRGWFDAVLLQCLGDCALGHPVTQVLQRALDPAVTPGGVVSGHHDDQPLDMAHQAWPSNPGRLVGPFGRDQAAIPAQDGVRGNDGGHLGEELPAQELSLGGQSAALGIRQAQTLATQLFLEDAVLFAEEVDDVLMPAVDPAGEGQEEELKGEERS